MGSGPFTLFHGPVRIQRSFVGLGREKADNGTRMAACGLAWELRARPQAATCLGGSALLQKEKIRVYILARDLNIETKDLLEICKKAGLDVKNQLSNLSPEEKEMIEQLVKKGAHTAPAAP